MASAVRELITGSPKRGPGKPLVRGQGGFPPEVNTFSFWTFTGSRKFVHFSKIWKRKKITDICVVFAEMNFNKVRYGTD